MKNINYQQIYEEEVSSFAKESLKLPDRYYELSLGAQRLVEELVDKGHDGAIGTILDVEVIEDTTALAAEMGSQLYNFANMLQSFLKTQNNGEEN
jgi:hypothetical protein